MAFLEWLQSTRLASFVAETLWAYPLFETLHTLGMTLLVASLGLVNLRVLGFKRELPIVGTLDFLPLAWLGFTVNLISGLALFSSDAVYFWSSITFRVKLALILLGGINAFVLGQTAFREARAGRAAGAGAGAGDGAGAVGAGAGAAAGAGAGVGVKLVAASSLLFWLGAIAAGRLIAYLP